MTRPADAPPDCRDDLTFRGRTRNTENHVAGHVLLAWPDSGAVDDEAAARENAQSQIDYFVQLGRPGVVVRVERIAHQDRGACQAYSSMGTPETVRGIALIGGNLLSRALGSFFLGCPEPRCRCGCSPATPRLSTGSRNGSGNRDHPGADAGGGPRSGVTHDYRTAELHPVRGERVRPRQRSYDATPLDVLGFLVNATAGAQRALPGATRGERTPRTSGRRDRPASVWPSASGSCTTRTAGSTSRPSRASARPSGVVLPRATAAAASTAPDRGSAREIAGSAREVAPLSVLLIDDEPLFHADVRQMLGKPFTRRELLGTVLEVAEPS